MKTQYYLKNVELDYGIKAAMENGLWCGYGLPAVGRRPV